MPVDINALEEWTVGDRMLGDILRGMTADDARQAEWRRGTLPPGQLGWRKAAEIRDQAALLATEAQQYRTADADRPMTSTSTSVAVDALTGTVSPVFGERMVSVTYSRLDGKHLLRVVDSVAGVVRSLTPPRLVGGVHRAAEARAPLRGSRAWVRPDGDAVEVLRELVAIYDAGRREPLPLPRQDVLRLGGRTALPVTTR